MNHLRTTALGGLCALALVVAGCGSDDDSPEGTDAAAATDAPGGTESPADRTTAPPGTFEPDPTGEIEESTGVLIAYSCVGPSESTGSVGVELCVVPSVDGEVVKLSEGASPVVGATWSPASSYLAFVCLYSEESDYDTVPLSELVDFDDEGFTRNRGGEICVVNADGSSGARATDTGGRAVAPAVSPDGTQVVYARTEAPDTDDAGLYLVGGTGGNEVRITSGRRDDFPAWSPDGTQIAFSSELGIAVVAPDGSRRVQLTDGGTGVDLGPTWSPDGNLIAFTRTLAGTGERETWVVSADGSNPRLVHTSAALTEPNVAVDVTPAWSPDGTRLAITVRASGDGPWLQAVVVHLEGGEPVALSPLPTDDTRWGSLSPTWSPDGEWLAFTSDHLGGEFLLFTVAPDGSQLFQLTEAGADALDPAWQP